jgi:transcriptional regulator with XRE-family HTH domain
VAAQPAIFRDGVLAAPTVADRCVSLGISQSFLAEFVGISKAELSRSLRDGNRPVQVNHALAQLETLVADFAPVPLRLDGNADQIRELVRSTAVMSDENRSRLQGAMEALAGN